MTCIVALTNGKKVYMAGDSAGVSGFDISIRKDPKVFVNKKFVMGFTSSFRMGDILKYRFNPPAIRSGQSLEQFMATNFIDKIRNDFSRYAYGKNESGEQIGGVFLVGHKGRLFLIDSDFQVGENQLPFNSCGCGHSYAMGSMYNDYVTMGEKFFDDPNYVLTKALRAATEFSAGVAEPFIFGNA